MNQQKRHEIIRILAELRPDPKSELNYTTPFELLIAVMLSAQATDKSVNLATAKLFAVANTPESILALGEEKLCEYIRTIGLYRTKARHCLATCKALIAEHHSAVPADFNALVRLPGVGSKTAKVVLNVAFGLPTIAVDTHIFRVANRTNLAPAKTPDAVSEKLAKIVPAQYARNLHHWLLLHGRYCCKAQKPLCSECPIIDLCEFKLKNLP